MKSQPKPPPTVAAARLEHRELLGPHAVLLAASLEEAGRWWAAAAEKVDDLANLKAAIPLSQRAVAALGRAMQHALYLTFLADATKAGVGRAYEISSYARTGGSPMPRSTKCGCG